MKGARGIFGYRDDASGRGIPRLGRDLAKHEAWVEAILPADGEASAPEGDASARPLTIFGLIAFALLVLLAVRLFDLQIVSGAHNLALADGNRTRETVSRAPRGLIFDRNGRVLAQNQASYDVTAVPQQLPGTSAERAALYVKVGAMIGMSPADVQAKAEKGCTPARPDACFSSPLPNLVLSGLAREQALLFGQSTAELPGFSLDVNPIRQYSDGGLLSPVLGYTGRVDAADLANNPGYGTTDLIGKLGLEQEYESVLRGTNGGQETEVDASGKPIKLLTDKAARPGANLVLSIDEGLEQNLSQNLGQEMVATGAVRAAAVAIDPRNGEILASVSLPGYDNNLFSKGISVANYENLLKDPGQPLFNKAESGAYPSGSIIKPLGASAALQAGIITSGTTIDDTGKLVLPNKYDPSNPSIYYGWERTSGLGPVNVIQALAQSSDIFFYEVMGGFTNFTHFLGIDRLASFYGKFGLGTKTGVDLPSETAGRVPTPDWKKAISGQDWYTGDTYNVAVGQGDILVSPLQMAVAVASIANGGTLYKPHFVTAVTDSNGKVVTKVAPTVVRQGFISPANLAIVRQGMLAAVQQSNGTACCKIKEEVPVQVAAKTGTAETVVHDDGSNPATQAQPNAWFEAFAPYDNPNIVIVALIEHGGEGAVAAAPVARETLAWYFTQDANSKQ